MQQGGETLRCRQRATAEKAKRKRKMSAMGTSNVCLKFKQFLSQLKGFRGGIEFFLKCFYFNQWLELSISVLATLGLVRDFLIQKRAKALKKIDQNWSWPWCRWLFGPNSTPIVSQIQRYNEKIWYVMTLSFPHMVSWPDDHRILSLAM